MTACSDRPLRLGSPDLNSIEAVYKSVKWKLLLIVVESAELSRAFVGETFERSTNCMSFAGEWSNNFLDSEQL
jgi:transposase